MRTSIRALHAQETKQTILNTALRLFREKSYSTVTVDDIVEAAGTSKGAFYYHFKSKDDLIAYEYSQSDDFYREIMESQLSKIDTAAEKLVAFAYMQAERTVQTVSPEVMKIFLGSHLTNPKMDNIITNPDRSLNKVVREIVEFGQKKGEFRSDIPAVEMSNAIVRAIRGIHYDWALQNYDLITETKLFFKYMLLPGILTEEAYSHKVFKME